MAGARKQARMTKADYETLAAFRYAMRRFLRFSEERVKSAGVTPQQYLALLAIKGFPGRDSVSIGELAERLQVRHHSAVGLVDRLASQGLVARGQAAEDKRQVLLSLTERGAAVLERLATMHREELRRIGPALNELFDRLSEE
jgi:DNA-binding MarR family transcriptional regulator